MTRAEAKIKLFELIENGFINFQEKGLIDSIFDDFESRTCENCEYYSRIGVCNNKESMMFDKLSVDNFCCNKWESKNEL